MYNKIIKDDNKGFFSEEEIREFTHKDCDDYLNYHTKEELEQIPLKDKQELILELEFNFQN